MKAEYHIVSAHGDSNFAKDVFDDLAIAVGGLLLQGWTPTGGVAVSLGGGRIVVAQALYKSPNVDPIRPDRLD